MLKHSLWFCLLSFLSFMPVAGASEMIPVPRTALLQLQTEFNLQKNLLTELQKNNEMLKQESIGLQNELQACKNQLTEAETLSSNAGRALSEVNTSFKAYSMAQKAKLTTTRRQRNFYFVLAGGILIYGLCK